MTEIELLEYKLEEERKAFDKLHKKHMDLLKQQGELEKENKELQEQLEYYKKQYRIFKGECNRLSRENEELLYD